MSIVNIGVRVGREEGRSDLCPHVPKRNCLGSSEYGRSSLGTLDMISSREVIIRLLEDSEFPKL